MEPTDPAEDSRTEEDPAGVAARRALVALAGRRGEETTVRAYLDDRAPAVRAGALAALIAADLATSADARAAITDPDAGVRRSACEHGARLPRVDLVALLDDEDPRVVEAAAFAIGEYEDHGALAALIVVAGSHADPLARESAIAALGALGDPAATSVLIDALDGPPAIRRRAVVALAAFEGDAVEAALRGRLTDHDWQVRQAAEDVLGASGDLPR